MIGLRGREEDISIANLVRGFERGKGCILVFLLYSKLYSLSVGEAGKNKIFRRENGYLRSLLRPLGRQVRYNWSDFEANLIEGH